MREFNLLYIDDQPDMLLSFYLEEVYRNDTIKYKYQSHIFKKEDTYESLLINEKVKISNVILIDSNLFENSSTGNKLFTGEEFRAILKHIYPYKEVVVITQNDPNQKYGIISKFNDDGSGDFKDFYNKSLKLLLDEKINEILIARELVDRVKQNLSLQETLLEKINNSLDGIEEYKELSSEDIKNLIEEFKELKRGIDG